MKRDFIFELIFCPDPVLEIYIIGISNALKFLFLLNHNDYWI